MGQSQDVGESYGGHSVFLEQIDRENFPLFLEFAVSILIDEEICLCAVGQ